MYFAVRLVGLELFGGVALELEFSPVVVVCLSDTVVHGVDHGGEVFVAMVPACAGRKALRPIPPP
jgi:hypothetical protein